MIRLATVHLVRDQEPRAQRYGRALIGYYVACCRPGKLRAEAYSGGPEANSKCIHEMKE